MLRRLTWTAAALCAAGMLSLPASAVPLGAGTRASGAGLAEDALVQEIRCQRICTGFGHRRCRLICDRIVVPRRTPRFPPDPGPLRNRNRFER
jgi:hypothetical protein